MGGEGGSRASRNVGASASRTNRALGKENTSGAFEFVGILRLRPPFASERGNYAQNDIDRSCLPKWIFERWTLPREQLSTGFRDVHVIFEADAELTRNVNARLIAESHVLGQQRSVAAHQIRPLVAVHAHTVAETMWKELVVWSIAGVGDDLARSCVHGLAFDAGPGCLQRRCLGAMNNVEHSLHLVGSFAEDESSRDVGNVAFDGATVIHKNDGALVNDLIGHRAMRNSGELANLHARLARKTNAVVSV